MSKRLKPGQWREALCPPGIGAELYAFAADIFPICRSITGPGVRETLSRVERLVPLTRTEIATGAQALDWTIPNEWTIRDAYIMNASGVRVLDFKANTLHVLNYSAPVRARAPLAELREHVFTLPDQPDLIPYRTSYYKEQWGFCMSHNALMALAEGEYEICIDATLAPGALTYGEFVHRGDISEEVLFQTHICHPSLANDNCSGISVLAHLAAALSRLATRYTYRFVFAPGTIGAIAWLSRNADAVRNIRHGLVVAGVGDAGAPTYKRTLAGDAFIDRAAAHVLRAAASSAKVIDYFPYGYDERQYNSPGFRLPVGLLQRSQFGTFPEYHTSADNLDFIAPAKLEDSLQILAGIIEVLECDGRYRNTAPYGEPQLGKRGLYAAIGGDKDAYAANMAMLWILNLADGEHSLLDIAERSALPFHVIAAMAELLKEKGLLAPAL